MSSTKDYFKEQYDVRIAQAQDIVDRIEADGRRVTAAEKQQVEKLVSEASHWKAKRQAILENEELRDAIERSSMAKENTTMTTTETKTSSLSDTILGAGFNSKLQPSVTVSAVTALGGTKANSFPAVADWNRTEPVTVAMGQDSRWLYPNLVIQDAGDAASIQDFKQSARTLTGTVKRALDATSAKANVDVTLALVNEALSQFATTVLDVPNALFDSVGNLRGFLESEAKFQVQKALDAHVFAQIVAASPPFDNTGTGLIEQVRNAISAMRALGANPDILVLNATDAANLDLSTSGVNTPYLFAAREVGASSPLWGLKVVERTSAAGTEPPYVIDSRMLGVLYLGPMRFDIDPFTGFASNLSNLRIETKALFHVRDANGAHRIAAA